MHQTPSKALQNRKRRNESPYLIPERKGRKTDKETQGVLN